MTDWIVGADTTLLSNTIATRRFSSGALPSPYTSLVSLVHLSWPEPVNFSDTTHPLVGSLPNEALSTSSPRTRALSSMNFVGAPTDVPQATTCWFSSSMYPGGRWLSFWQLTCG